MDVRDLLSKPADSFKPPPTLPPGTYHGLIRGADGKSHEFGKSGQKQTPYVRYFFTLQRAGDDVDATELEGVDLAKRSLRKDFYLTDDAAHRLTTFLKSVGVNVEHRSFNETIPEAAMAQVMIKVIKKPNQDGQDFHNEVGDVVADA